MHPKIATILPFNHLPLVKEDEYFMALSHACDHEPYLEFYAARAHAGAYVIIDNSVIELGKPEKFVAYVRKAKRMGASEILLPDYYPDAKRTLSEAKFGIARLRDMDYAPNIMVVPQGLNLDEWVKCCNYMMDLPEVTTIGISARYTEMFGGSRLSAVDLVGAWRIRRGREDIKVHLLGCYADPAIEVEALNYSFVRGIDSSYPAVFTRYGVRIGDVPRPKEREIDWVSDSYDADLLKFNLKAWWRLCDSTQ